MEAPVLAAPAAPPRRLLLANTAALVLAYALPRAFTLLSAVVAARVLGAAEFGVYTAAGAVAVVASIVATLGMQPLLVREVARAPGRASSLLAAAHAVKLGTVVLMALALAGASLLGFPPAVLAAAALLGVGYGIGAFVENLAGYFQGVEEMHVWTQASALLGIVTGGAGVLLVVATRDLLWLCAAAPLGQAAALAWLLRRAPAEVRRPPLPSAATVAALLRRLAPFALAFVGTTVFYRADVLLLTRLRPPEEVGLYGAAHRFLDVTQALALAGAGALLPHLSRVRGAAAGAVRRFLALLATFTAPLAVALFVLREPLVEALYGPAYRGAAPLLATLAPAVVPLAANMFALAALGAADAMGVAAVLYLGGAAVNVALNLAWIPSYGAGGAAAVALVSETGLMLGLLLALRARSVR